MDNEHKTVAYIIGNHFDTLAQLPNVYTLNQFFSAILTNCLPQHRLWIVGQGIHAAVREILSLCEKYRTGLHFHFGSLALNEQEAWTQLHELFSQAAVQAARSTKDQDNPNQQENKLEWCHFQFVDANRIKADLKLSHLSEDALLAHDFVLTAARELSEKACRYSMPNGKLLLKSAQLNSFHRFFPLPITVETQFQLTNDNTRSLKSLTRFYQDYACIAEAHLSFDLHTETEAKKLLRVLGEKTFTHFSDKMKNED